MSLTLIDWLYQENKEGALILFPNTFNRWDIAFMIVSKWEKYKVVIVTDHPDKFLSNITYNDWTETELVIFTVIKYSDLEEINTVMSNTEIDIILFDDARMLSIILPALKINCIVPTVLVLTTWGDTLDQLEKVTTSFPNLSFLSLSLPNQEINWVLRKAVMSNKQVEYYQKVVEKEKDYDGVISYPLSRMITLYTYPDNIMEDTLKQKYICQTDQLTSPDNLNSEGSWINTSYLHKLTEDSPKLLLLLAEVKSHKLSKQLIITRYNHRYGVDLITSFLKLIFRSHIFSVSCTDDYNDSLKNLHKFNKAASGILVTNITPFIPLEKVSIVHITDNYTLLNIQKILDSIVKDNFKINVYSYISVHPKGEKSTDEILYNKLVNNIEQYNLIYNTLNNNALNITLDQN